MYIQQLPFLYCPNTKIFITISESIPKTDPESAPGKVRGSSFTIDVRFEEDLLSGEKKPVVRFTWEYAKCQGRCIPLQWPLRFNFFGSLVGPLTLLHPKMTLLQWRDHRELETQGFLHFFIAIAKLPKNILTLAGTLRG